LTLNSGADAELNSGTLPSSGLCPSTVSHLEVEFELSLDPAVLAPLQQLQHMRYIEGYPFRVGTAGCGTAGGAAALFAQLAHMTRLTCLQLKCAARAGPRMPAAFSALTASSALQRLEVDTATYGEGVVMFQDMWQHAFPAGLQLPHLHHLVLSANSDDDPAEVVVAPVEAVAAATPAATADEPFSGSSSPASRSHGRQVPWQQQCLSRLVSCCPSLQSLDITWALSGPVVLTPLLQLPHLTALSVQHVSDADVWNVLARLPGLCRLTVGCASAIGYITAFGLRQLSTLQITSLSLAGDGNLRWSDAEDAPGYHGDYALCQVDDSTLAVVAQFTSLRQLQLQNHTRISDEGMLQLTALRQLTELDVCGKCGLLGFGRECTGFHLPTEVSTVTTFCI
jgi:hypothetical protein